MKEIEEIKAFLMKYSDIHYRKPNENNNMLELYNNGHNAREKFKRFGESISQKVEGFNIFRCSNWVKMNQIIPNYLWIQLKKDGFETCPSSISLAAKKIEDTFCFYVAVEIKNMAEDLEDFINHNKILEMKLLDKELYYSSDDEEFFYLGRDAEYVKSIIKQGKIKKVRIQKNINYCGKIEEVTKEVVEAIKILETYYNKIILDKKTK